MPMKPGPGGYKVKSYQINDRLISNNTGIYVVERLLQSGENSQMYVVNRLLQGERDDSYRYFVKQQSLSREAAERARTISNKLNQSVFSEVGTLLELTLPVIEVFEFNGDVFSLMKYYDGGMFLEDIIFEQLESMSAGDIFELFGRILRNTEKIHYLAEKEGGILHLDVHPGNIFCCNAPSTTAAPAYPPVPPPAAGYPQIQYPAPNRARARLFPAQPPTGRPEFPLHSLNTPV